jgi:cobalt/nickel transport protein
MRRIGAWLVALLVAAAGGGWALLLQHNTSSGEWPGVDEAVVGRVAEAAGRPEPAFAITWIHGDLLLFTFLCAGLIAGALLGFYGRAAFYEAPRKSGEE